MAITGPTVFTVGVGDLSFAELEELCETRGVGTLIDVRSRPTPSFADPARVAGVGYLPMGDRLGARLEGLASSDGTPVWKPAAAGEAFLAAVSEVLLLATDSPVALVCDEPDPDACHRSTLLAPALEEGGGRVLHILPDGSLRLHQPRLAW